MTKKSLNTLHFEFKAEQLKEPIDIDFHFGVVGSGDMEVLIHPKKNSNKAEFKVVTPVTGFEHVWEKVLQKFVNESGVHDVLFEINDNNATPAVVSLRLYQSIGELVAAGKEGE